jgi:hypothetical protein
LPELSLKLAIASFQLSGECLQIAYYVWDVKVSVGRAVD